MLAVVAGLDVRHQVAILEPQDVVVPEQAVVLLFLEVAQRQTLVAAAAVRVCLVHLVLVGLAWS